MTRHASAGLLVVSCALIVGCETKVSTKTLPPSPPVVVNAEPAVPAGQAPPGVTTNPGVVAPMEVSPDPVLVPAVPATETGPELAQPTSSTEEAVRAEVGVGQKGRSLDEYEGALVTPAKAYFSVREKVIFEIQIPQAMQFYKAESGNGPKTHEEFMEKIIAANQIKLPELPTGQRYQYNVELDELQVIRPKK